MTCVLRVCHLPLSTFTPLMVPQLKALCPSTCRPPHQSSVTAGPAAPGLPAAPSAHQQLASASTASEATVARELPAGPAFPQLVELNLNCSSSSIGGGVVIQLDALQAAMPSLEILKLSGLGGLYGGCNRLTTPAVCSLYLISLMCFVPSMSHCPFCGLMNRSIVCLQLVSKHGLVLPIASCNSCTGVNSCLSMVCLSDSLCKNDVLR